MEKAKTLYVISGPSGAGLRDIISKVLESREDIGTVMPITSRKMKAGETNGVGFFFYDLDGWNMLKETGDLLETTQLAGNDYGTSKRLVKEQLEAGKNVILNLEVERAAQIKKTMPEAVCIYIEPSTPELLRKRYEAICRSPLEVSARMEMADWQRKLADFCDYKVSSDEPSAAVEELSRLIG